MKISNIEKIELLFNKDPYFMEKNFIKIDPTIFKEIDLFDEDINKLNINLDDVFNNKNTEAD